MISGKWRWLQRGEQKKTPLKKVKGTQLSTAVAYILITFDLKTVVLLKHEIVMGKIET